MLERFPVNAHSVHRLIVQKVDQKVLTHGFGKRGGWVMISFESFDSRANQRGVFSTGSEVWASKDSHVDDRDGIQKKNAGE